MANNEKHTPRYIAEKLHEQAPKLTWIAGRWWHGNEEIKDARRYIAKASKYIQSPNQLQAVMDMYRLLYGDECGKWPELPIIAEARAKTNTAPLAFPLNNKQLKIIRVLLEGTWEIAFILTGIGGSGKSTYLNIIKQIFGNDVGACSISELGGYQLAEALKHRLIASDELSCDDLKNSIVKTVISRQPIQVNPKFETPYQTKAQSSLIWSCNKPPRLDLTDTGLMRRIVYYSMNTKIENPDPSMRSHEYTHDELVDIVKAALDIDMTDWYDDFRLDTYRYMLQNNSVWLCRNDVDDRGYEEYVRCALRKRLKPYSEPVFNELQTLIDNWIEECPDIIPEQDELPF